MKYILIFILSFFFYFSVEGKNIYLSNSGSNSNTGLSQAQAWQTLYKLNSMFPSATIVAGDSILFQRGSTFYGFINPTKSVKFGDYGSGAKPIISGFYNLNGWTLVGGNIWGCAPDSTTKQFCNILTINGVPQAVGRTPNANTWYTYQSATTTQLSSTSINGTPSYVGAEVVIKKVAYVGERAIVTAQTVGTPSVLTYGTTPKIDPFVVIGSQGGFPGYGFFFQRFAASLDAQGEWYFAPPPTNRMQIYSTVDPNTLNIQASYVDTLVKMGPIANVSFNNIKFEGANLCVFMSKDGSGINITNCDFVNNTRVVNFHNTGFVNILNNTFDKTFNCGVFIYNAHNKAVTIQDNTFTNSGQLFGMGIFATEGNLRAIYSLTDSLKNATNFQNIIGNRVINTGSSGIRFNGSNMIIRRNIVDTFCNLLDDGGGIYTFTSGTPTGYVAINRIMDSNFVSNSSGAAGGVPGGVNGTQVSGIYLDDLTQNLILKDNTVWNIFGAVKGNGFQTSNALNVNFRNNTVYNTSFSVNVNKKDYSNISGLVIHRNILYQKTNTQYNFRHINTNINLPTPMTITQSLTNLWDMDSNWISNIKSNGLGYTYYYSTNGSSYTFPPDFNLNTWQTTYGHDVHSTLPPVTYTGTNSNIYPNPSDVPLVVNFLGLRKRDPKGVIYDNFAVVPRWSSLILIDDGNAPVSNIPPVANAGANQVITLPTSSTSVTATATDADGTIAGYTWVKLAGSPPGGTITSPNSATTTITGLQAGTYIYQVTATDNLGATGTDQMQILVNPAANILPTANAGSDQTITLPTSIANLNGSGADADGTIVSYAWVKLASSPSGGTISNPNIAAPSLSGLIQGVYQYQLTVTDNQGGTGKDTVRITVNPAPNQPPVANAGADQIITLPTNATSINGLSSTDPDGTIVSYVWVKLAGSPAGGTLATPNAATTNVSSLQFGTYTYRLTVTDNFGLTATDQMQITVNAAPNQPPTSIPGANFSITLPVTSSTLNGSGTDPDGTISAYLWTFVSGPTTATVASPATASTGISNMTIAGDYTFSLKVTDNGGLTDTKVIVVTVLPAIPPSNNPPVANAGADKNITLPTNSVSVTGTATDSDGTITGVLWTKTSGPATFTIATPTSLTTNITGLVQGVYTFNLQVTDDDGDTDNNSMVVTVNAAPNVNPTANAGTNQTITLPTNSTTLTGSGTDPDGTISSYLWTQISGAGAGITTPNAQNTGITGLAQGIYVFQLQVTDNSGGTGTATVQVTVNAAPVNIPPTANAGIDQTTQLPTNSVIVVGSGNDPDGTIAGYVWTKISGPATYTIATPTASTTNITNLVVGVYKFVLTVTDNLGLTGKDTIQITVIAANVLPTADAGVNQIITLPTNSVTLTGSGTDPDGTISSYHWVKLSGTGSTIVSPNAATTNITGLQVGTYIFELTVTDNLGGTGTDQVQVTVLAADILPTANAGPNLAITLPDNDTLLVGSGTDVDGTIVSYQWTLDSGPAGSNFGTPNAATTTFNNLTSVSTTVAGVYIVRLTVTDDNGGTGSDTVQITVNPAVIPSQAYLLRGYKIN